MTTSPSAEVGGAFCPKSDRGVSDPRSVTTPDFLAATVATANSAEQMRRTEGGH